MLLTRLGTAAGALVCAITAFIHVPICFGKLVFPAPQAGLGASFLTYPDPFNPLAIGLSLTSLFLLAASLNVLFHDEAEGGPADIFFVEIASDPETGGGGYTVCAVLAMLLFGSLTGLLVGKAYTFEFDDRTAAELFTHDVEAWDIHNSGRILFADRSDSSAIVSPLTPRLHRALQRARLIIGSGLDQDRNLAIPGVTPIAFLILLFLFGVIEAVRCRGEPTSTRFHDRAARNHARVALLTTFTSLYVLGWFAVGQYGNEIQIFQRLVRTPESSEFRVMPDRTVPGLIRQVGRIAGLAQEVAAGAFLLRRERYKLMLAGYLVLALGMLWCVARLLENTSRRRMSRIGWGVLVYTMQAVAMVAVLFATHLSNGTPVLPWISTYVTMLTLCWLATSPGRNPRQSAQAQNGR